MSKKKKRISKSTEKLSHNIIIFLVVAVCCTGTIFLILLVLAAGVAAVLIGFAVKQYRSNQPTTERYHENSSVILTELDHFYTKSLTVTEDTEHLNDFRHDIEVFHAECKCSDLVTLTTYTLNGSDVTPIPPVYALAGSSISVHICGSTNATTESERLEIVLKNHLEEANLPNEVPFRVNFFYPGLDGKRMCKDVIFHLPANDYYTMIFVLNPSSPIDFDYELIYKTQAIESHLLAEHSLANYILRADQESCKFSLSSDINKQSCFVAMIRENPNTTKGDVHIQLKYGNRMGGFIAGIVVLSATAFIASIVVLSLLIRRAVKHAKVE